MMYLHLLYTRLHTSTSESFHAHLVYRLHLVVDIIDHSINEMEVAIKVNKDIGGLDIGNLVLAVEPDVIHIDSVAMRFKKIVYLFIGGITKRLYERLLKDNTRLSHTIVGKAHDDVGIIGKQFVVSHQTMNETI